MTVQPDRTEVPRIFVYVALLLLCLMLVPPALVARMRATTTPNRRIHLIQDMDNQAHLKAQQANPVFADGRAMRIAPEGTIARSDVRELSAFVEGKRDGEWMKVLPAEVPLTMETLRRGQDRFNIYCALCHGYAGFGDGMIHERAMELVLNAEGPVHGTQWVQPSSLHDADIPDQPVGQIFNTITHGIRNMAGYASQIPVADRWAIAAYVKALQASQNADPSQLSESVRTRLGIDSGG